MFQEYKVLCEAVDGSQQFMKKVTSNCTSGALVILTNLREQTDYVVYVVPTDEIGVHRRHSSLLLDVSIEHMAQVRAVLHVAVK